MAHEFEELTDEVRLTFHALSRVAEVAHRDRGVTPQMRAVLAHLAVHDDRGGTTVPRIAEARGVSRQHIQTIVNDLSAAGMVEHNDNPAHRRSRLIGLTAAGRSVMAGIADDEAVLFVRIGAEIPETDREITARTLRRLREELRELVVELASETRETPR